MIYLIGDLHLGHGNIIKYCNRPFKSVEEMNEELLSRWNGVVGKHDTVLFLGDLAFGNPAKWMSQLNGEIIFIRGNHDRFGLKTLILEYGNQEVILVHNPANIDWQGGVWTIHGHIHNNNLEEYPLVNTEEKTINVSCELINYTPIPMEEVLTLMEG